MSLNGSNEKLTNSTEALNLSVWHDTGNKSTSWLLVLENNAIIVAGDERRMSQPVSDGFIKQADCESQNRNWLNQSQG